MTTTQKDGSAQMLKETVEHVWLAGLGALALTEEEGSKFFRSLVKKGEGVEKRSLARVNDALEAARKAPADAIEKLQDRSDKVVENVMHRLGVPTRREISGLTRRIEGLAGSMEKKPRARRAATRTKTHAGMAAESTTAP